MPNSSRQKLADLTDELIRQTRRRTVRWETTAEEGVFRTTLGNYSVTIYKSEETEHRLSDVHIQLLNERGVVIDSFADPDLSGLEPTDYDGYFGAMLDLYAMATGQATGADQALDEMLGLLKSM